MHSMKTLACLIALGMAVATWMSCRPALQEPESIPDTASIETHDPGNRRASTLEPKPRTAANPLGMGQRWDSMAPPEGPGPLHDHAGPPAGYVDRMLQGMDAMTRVSDAMMANPSLSKDALVTLLIADGLSDERARQTCATYPVGSESLPALYARTVLNPEWKAVRDAMEAAGVTCDPAKDCLLECHRIVVAMGEVRDFVRDVQQSLVEAFGEVEAAAEVESLAREATDAEAAFSRRFRDRLIRRHGLTEAESESLLRALAGLRVPSATVSDLYIPIRPGP